MKRTFNFKKTAGGVLAALARVSLPLVVLLFVTQDLTGIAFAAIFLFKWRVLAVKSRYWLANIRANMVDILVGVSIVEFMSNQTNGWYVGGWFVFHIAWALYIKKLSTIWGMLLQGLLAFSLAYSALLSGYGNEAFGLQLAAVWFLSYFSARHILSAFSEDHAPHLAHIWALFSVQAAWVFWHFQVTYFFVERPVLLLTIILASLGTTYALSKAEESNKQRIQQIFISTAIMTLIIILQRVETQV